MIDRRLVRMCGAFALALMWSAPGTSRAAGGGLSPVSVDLNVAEVMHQIGDGIAYVLARHDRSSSAAVQEALPRLQVDLSRLVAAKKNVIATLRQALASSTPEEKKQNELRISASGKAQLATDYGTIKATLAALNGDMRRLDPAQGARDTKLTEDLFSRFMSQGGLTNDLGQLMNVKFDAVGDDYDLISDRDKIAAFVSRFDTVKDIEALNARITQMRRKEKS